MAMIKNLTMQNFHEETDNGVTVIDFWASWCGPCRKMSEVVDELADERSDIKVCKVNVDEERDLAMAFGVMSIPTIVLMENGVLKAKAVGYMELITLKAKLGIN